MGILVNKKTSATAGKVTSKKVGDAAEDAACDFLLNQGMRLLMRNYRTPGRGGGEIDIVASSRDGTLVFVEVRKRSGASHGGAAASVGFAKRRRIVFAARHYLMHLATVPPCRFDVIAVEADGIHWLQAAFDAE